MEFLHLPSILNVGEIIGKTIDTCVTKVATVIVEVNGPIEIEISLCTPQFHFVMNQFRVRVGDHFMTVEEAQDLLQRYLKESSIRGLA